MDKLARRRQHRKAALLGALLLLLIGSLDHATAQIWPQCPRPPVHIWVERFYYYSTDGSQGEYYANPAVDLDYLTGVLIGELGGTVPPPGDPVSWHDEALKAQSVAARTWGAYWCHKWMLGNGQSGVYDGGPDQVYRPYRPGSESYQERYTQRVNDVRGTYMTHPSSPGAFTPYYGVTIDAEYGAENGDPTVEVSGYDYLRSVSDPVCSGQPRDGNGWGFCQHGSQRWATQHDWTWQQMLYHYYTSIDFQQSFGSAGSYYNGDFATFVGQRDDGPINFDWGTGSPMTGVNSDDFSVRWFSYHYFYMSGWHTFYVTADGGVRLRVDDTLILNEWYDDQTRRTYSVAMALEQGWHSIELEYYDQAGNATVRLSWLAGQGMTGRYFSNTTYPAGQVVMQRIDVPIDYNWPAGVSPKNTYPDKLVSDDNFAVRWEGKVWITSPGYYRFFATVDDGVRLYVDDILRLNEWQDQSVTTFATSVYLSSGPHSLRMDYYEHFGDAVAKLWWATNMVYIPIIGRNYQ